MVRVTLHPLFLLCSLFFALGFANQPRFDSSFDATRGLHDTTFAGPQSFSRYGDPEDDVVSSRYYVDNEDVDFDFDFETAHYDSSYESDDASDSDLDRPSESEQWENDDFLNDEQEDETNLEMYDGHSTADVVDRMARKGRECAPCANTNDCGSELKCWKNMCVLGTKKSEHRCKHLRYFSKPDCASCRHANECKGRRCIHGKCAPNATTFRRCHLRRECYRCSKHTECITGFCSRNKCVHRTRKSLEKCFLRPECGTCQGHSQCATRHCSRGKCINPKDPKSRQRCFKTPSLRKECHRCSKHAECATNFCARNKCVHKTRRSLEKCFPRPECAKCQSNSQCATKRCSRGICINPRIPYSKQRCRKKPECGKCKHHQECVTRLCASGRCVFHTSTSIKKCLHHTKDRCQACKKNFECKSGLTCLPSNVQGQSSLCAKGMGPGKSCRDPCWACERGLVCGKSKRCEKPLANKCQNCKNTKDCKRGLVCKPGSRGKPSKCAEPKQEGMSCADPCWACATGLQCRSGRCRKQAGGKCHKCSTTGDCVTGLICKRGLKGNPSRCAEPKREGMSCADPCWTCASGLKCQSGKCTKPRAGKCHPCKSNADCKKGLLCTRKSRGGQARCTQVSRKGMSCAKACSTCQRGLSCKNGVCQSRPLGLCQLCKLDQDCRTGLFCNRGKAGATSRCAKLREKNETCSSPCAPCKKGFVCKKNRCEKKAGAKCDICTVCEDCAKGLTCKRGKTGKPSRCAERKGLGMKCTDPCWACKPELQCRDGKCQKPLAKKCEQCQKNADCATGLVCKPGVDNKSSKCAELKDLGMKCSDPCWACKPGLQCRGGTCRNPHAKKCEKCQKNADCVKGLVCKPGAGDRPSKCAEPKGLGMKCSDPCWACKPGLQCRDGRCRNPPAKKCGECQEDDDCVKGLICKPGVGGKPSKCAEPKGLGMKCSDPCWACKPQFQCRDGRCRNPPAKKCGECQEDDDCVKGLICKPGVGGKPSKCAEPKGLGMKCSDPCWACKPQFQCRDGKCRNPPTPKCGNCRENADCIDGLICKSGVGGRPSKCAEQKDLGMKCSDPCWACKPQFQCRDGKCRNPPAKKCGNCSENADCIDGLICKPGVGGRPSKCAEQKDLGMKCSDPCWACKPGLQCRGGKCRNPPTKKCGECQEDGDCIKGLICKPGVGGKPSKCAEPKGLGMKCSDPCWACKPQFQCRGGKCRNPPAKKCGNCSENADCIDGLICKPGVGGKPSKCAEQKDLGMKCSDPCWACKPQFQCRGGKCRNPPAKKCGECQEDGDCIKGLICKPGVGGRPSKCAEPKGLGMKCSDPCWACKPQFQCRGGKCRNPPVNKCGNCSENADCIDGLICKPGIGGKPSKCAEQKDLGMKCSDPCWACKPQFQCRDGKCKNPLAKKCGECQEDDDCVEGLICKPGVGGKPSKCAEPKGLGMKCSDPCWACEKTLECRGGSCQPRLKCMKNLAYGMRCSKGCRICRRGLHCRNEICRGPPGTACATCTEDGDCAGDLTCAPAVEAGKRSRCAAKQAVGARCSAPCYPCADGLTCANGRCAKLGGKCAACDTEADCADGLACKRAAGGARGKCAERKKAGMPCGDPCWACEKHLTCHDGVCA